MTDIDELYQSTIVEHDRTPRNWGTLDDATHHATVDNPLCGDVVTVQTNVSGDILRNIAVHGRGCALSRAAASIMSMMVRDRGTGEARQLSEAFEAMINAAPDSAIADELGELRAFAGVRRFRSRRVCATLPFRALMLALDTPSIADEG